jgi:hypothetical protein
MATLAPSAAPERKRRSEAQSFFILACCMAATIVAGFLLNVSLGRSTFASPLVVHVHGITFMGWLAITLTQMRFAAAGPLGLHRKLGWISVIYVPWMLLMGALIMRHSLQTTGGPFFFAQNEFMWGNSTMLCAFAVLIGWAIASRRDTAAHSRLMLCAFTVLTGPGLGRLLPAPLMIPYAWQALFVAVLIWPAIGMVLDYRRHGAVHRAWFKGVAVIVAFHLISQIIAHTPMGISATRAVVAGTPGAERPLGAFLPPGFGA